MLVIINVISSKMYPGISEYHKMKDMVVTTMMLKTHVQIRIFFSSKVTCQQLPILLSVLLVVIKSGIETQGEVG